MRPGTAGHPWLPGTAPERPSALPIVPREYHDMLRTPRLRWWRPVLALLMGAAAFLIVSTVLTLPAVLYDVAVGNTTWDDYTSVEGFKTTPAFFFGNNVALASGILIAGLSQWACFGQRPRWLSSIQGRFRWGWFGECVLWTLPLFLLSMGIEIAISGMPDLRVSPTTWFMIAVILLTTPLQAAGEEYMLRGLAARAIAAWFPRVAGLVVSTAVTAGIFMLLHGAGDPWLNAFYVLFAVVASVLVWRTGGLESAVAVHAVNNVVSMTFLPFVDISDIFNRSAGVAGPGVLIQMGLLLVAAALVLWRAKRRGVQARFVPEPSVSGPPLGPRDQPGGGADRVADEVGSLTPSGWNARSHSLTGPPQPDAGPQRAPGPMTQPPTQGSTDDWRN